MAGALVRWCVVRCGGGGWASLGGRFPALRGASGVRRCPSPGAGSRGSATRVSQVRSMRACGSSTGPTACALAGRRCSLWGWRKGVPGGGAFHRCEGRLVSGAVPPPAARRLERAARVPRPVCPGCGRCGRVDPAPAPQRAPMRAGVARRGGGGRASPGGVSSTVARGIRRQALSLPRPSVLRSGQSGFRVPCVPGAVGAGVETQHWPRSARPCGPALLSLGVAEGRPRGGGAFHHCEGRLVSGAVPPPVARPLERAARALRPVCPGCGRCGRGDPAPAPRRAPLRAGVARRGGGGRASPGGAFHNCEGRLVSGAVPPPAPSSGAGSQGSASRVSRVRSVRAWGPSTGSTTCALAGRRCWLWGWRKGVPGGGAFHRCEGRLVSGAVPPPAARPLERAAGVPRPVCPGCGWCGCGDPAPAPQRAPVRAGVARCGGGGGASPGGGVLPTVVRGAWCQALSLPWPPVLWGGQPGFRVPRVPGAVGAGVGTQHRPHSVRPCGPALLAVGVAEGRPRGGCLPPL